MKHSLLRSPRAFLLPLIERICLSIFVLGFFSLLSLLVSLIFDAIRPTSTMFNRVLNFFGLERRQRHVVNNQGRAAPRSEVSAGERNVGVAQGQSIGTSILTA